MLMNKLKGVADKLTIGRLAKAAGVNIETIRYYQRIGLIAEPKKPLQGFRTYSIETAENIKFIKRAQRLGFSLKEIAELLSFGSGHCEDIRQRAEQKRDRIDAQIDDLQTLRTTLTGLITACHAGEGQPHCPIVKTLLNDD